MGSFLRHRYKTDGSVAQADVRMALRGVPDSDLSESSPVSAGVPEAGLSETVRDGDHLINVTVEGHPGDWTKTSEEAVKQAVLDVDGVEELAEAEGGYEG